MVEEGEKDTSPGRRAVGFDEAELAPGERRGHGRVGGFADGELRASLATGGVVLADGRIVQGDAVGVGGGAHGDGGEIRLREDHPAALENPPERAAAAERGHDRWDALVEHRTAQASAGRIVAPAPFVAQGFQLLAIPLTKRTSCSLRTTARGISRP